MTPEFWMGRRVFLTGHTGFKGSWLSLWLQSLGAEVTGFALQNPTNPSLFELADIDKGITSIIGDVQNINLLTTALISSKPEIVIHMAAQSLVRESYSNPIETYLTNVMGTVNLLEAVRKCESVRAVLNVTTDKCYENREWLWGYRENESLGGHDPYSSSKACSELVTSAYRNSYFNTNNYMEHGVAVASARAGNVIGGGDWARHRLIPDVLNGFMDGQTVYIRHPNAIRPWQHVLEPLCGYLLLAEHLYKFGASYAEAWNFGPVDEDAKSVSWVVDRLCALWGPGVNWRYEIDESLHEAHHLKLDTSKARSKLGWLPKLSLEETLKLTVEWAKWYGQGFDVREKTLMQIKKYQEI